MPADAAVFEITTAQAYIADHQRSQKPIANVIRGYASPKVSRKPRVIRAQKAPFDWKLLGGFTVLLHFASFISFWPWRLDHWCKAFASSSRGVASGFDLTLIRSRLR